MDTPSRYQQPRNNDHIPQRHSPALMALMLKSEVGIQLSLHVCDSVYCMLSVKLRLFTVSLMKLVKSFSLRLFAGLYCESFRRCSHFVSLHESLTKWLPQCGIPFVYYSLIVILVPCPDINICTLYLLLELNVRCSVNVWEGFVKFLIYVKKMF